MTLNKEEKQAILWWFMSHDEAYRILEHTRKREECNAYPKGSYAYAKKCYDIGLELKNSLKEENKKVIL